MSVNIKMTAIADEIRELSGTTGKLSLDAMATNVEAANSEVDNQSNLLEQALALLDGKAGGAGGITPEGTITITENGTHNVTSYALANVALPEAEQATPTISVNSSGLITASTTQTAGVVKAGTKSNTKQLTVQAAKTVTPSTSSQTAVASGRYTTGAVTVAGDSDLVAGNIKKGVSIFNVEGTYTSDATATASDMLNGKTAYVNGSKVTGTMINHGGIYGIISNKSASYVVPSGYHSGSGNVIISPTEQDKIIASNIKSGVSILGVTGTYSGSGGIDTSDATATANDIQKNATAYVNGEKITGTLEGVQVVVAEDDAQIYYNSTGQQFTVWGAGTGEKQILSPTRQVITYLEGDLMGDATAADVVSGKTFTSKNGLKVTGTATIGGAGGIAVTQGSYTPSSDLTGEIDIPHDLGQTPNFYILTTRGNTKPSDLIGYANTVAGTESYFVSGTSNQKYITFCQRGYDSTSWLASMSGNVDSYHTANTFRVDIIHKLKAGVTYDFICGVRNVY